MEEKRAQGSKRQSEGGGLCFENSDVTQAQTAHAVGYAKALTIVLEGIVPEVEEVSE